MYEDDEIWDEHRWEAFFKENDKMVDRYMEHMHRFMRDNPQPEEGNEEALARWRDQLDAYVGEQMGWNFEEAEDGDEPPFFPDEEWDPFVDEEESPFDAFEKLPLYQKASEIAMDVLKWAHELPGEEKDAQLVEFCANATQVGAAIAKGSAFGLERDMIGGNIASLKRGIRAANTALAALQAIKHAPFMRPGTYRHFYERIYELRNDLGLYIQELRERFERGVD